MSIQEQLGQAAPLVDRVNEAIRENPLAAGLIGAGVAWMLFGTKGFGAVGDLAKSAGGKVASAAANVGSAAASAATTAVQAGSTAAAAVKGAAAGMAEAAASIVPGDITGPSVITDAAADAGAAAGDGLKVIASAGGEYGAAFQSRLSDSLERQPLLLGAIGLAIGAGIASTFATTSLENEWMGDKAEEARETLKGVGDELKQRAGQVVTDVQTEAVRQGLTIDSVKDAAASLSGKARNVAETARNAAKQRFK